MAFKAILAKPIPLEQVEGLVEAELARILATVFPPPVQVSLFGSAARGEMSDASDLDFLIVLPDEASVKEARLYSIRSGFRWRARLSATLRSELGLELAIQCFVLRASASAKT